MNAPRKFKAGPVIDTFADLEECLNRDGYVFIFGDQPKHVGFVRSLRYSTVRGRMDVGAIRRALITDEWATWSEQHKDDTA